MPSSETRVVVYVCNWDAYSALDAAGLQRLAYPPGVQIVRVPCLGRLHSGLVLRSFEFGASGVLLLGCSPDRCRHGSGGRQAKELHSQTLALARLLGIGPNRIGLETVAEGDGDGLARLIRAFVAGLESEGERGPLAVAATRAHPGSDAIGLASQHRANYCLDCGKCTSACPVAWYEDGFSPRAIVEATRQRSAVPSDEGRIWSCLTCRRCEVICPSGVQFSDYVRDLRAASLSSGTTGHCSHGQAIQAWMRLMAWAELDQNRLDWLTDNARTSVASDTVYFVGCLPHYDVMFAGLGVDCLDVARSGIAVLNGMGVTPAVLPDELCCGHDLLWQGDVASFRRLAERNTELLKASGARRLVTACPECAYTLRTTYPEHGYNPGVEVLHMAEFAAAGGLPAGSQPRGAVTYQDPCRLGRFMGAYEEPRLAMRAAGWQVREMDPARSKGLCCGTSAWTSCGASSKRMQVARLQQAAETGADLLVTACVKCQVHLLCALQDRDLGPGLRLPIKDFTVLMAEAMK